jgi:hypothetical protein
MDCTANLPRKSRRINIFAISLFVAFLALQPGYSEQSAAVPEPAISSVAPAPARISVRPFSKVAIGVTAGTLGVGLEVATPLSRRTNLRVDSHFFNYAQTLSQDGVSYNGTLHLRDLRASYDFFPFGGSFRVSGGIAVYNQFNARALASVPSNQTITLNDVDYYSSAADPLRGNATISYGNKVAPTFTLGWGNAIPRSGRHLAFPVEIGAAFTGTPTFDLALAGSACETQNAATCEPIAANAGFQSNLNAERKKINNDIEPLRFYPILNLGVTYRF